MGDVGAGQGESLSAAAHELASSPIGYAAELLAAMPSRRAALLLAFMDFGRAVDRISVMPPAHALAILREMDEVLAGRLLGRLLAHEVRCDLASVDPSWLGRVLRRMEFEHVEIALGGMAPEAAARVLNNMPLQETAGILERWSGNSFPFSSIMDQFFGVSAPGSGARPLNGKVLDILSAMESPEVAEILRAASSYAFAADVMQAMPHARMVPVLALMSVDETAAMLTSVRTSPDHHSVPRFPAQRAAEVILGPRSSPCRPNAVGPPSGMGGIDDQVAEPGTRRPDARQHERRPSGRHIEGDGEELGQTHTEGHGGASLQQEGVGRLKRTLGRARSWIDPA
ncbi:hypothetical protein [Nonomuraea sp. NPDC046570]|uniref:hypothetical protein n=1 Tax=Nonomuraea sp. NPDC046570 TaxID=3155255 RepID=UPI0033BFC4E5